MDWSSVKGLVGKFAPWIAGAFGTPAMGAAVGVLCGALGLDEKTKPEDIDVLFKSGTLTGDQLKAMREADQAFQVQMKQLDITSIQDLEALAVDDRKSAREREVAVRDHTPAVGFYAITAGFFGLLGMMLYHIIPEANKTALDVMVGSLGTAWIGCVNYYYGSSSSSRSKTEMLYRSTPKE